jgi:hypothetical protein
MRYYLGLIALLIGGCVSPNTNAATYIPVTDEKVLADAGQALFRFGNIRLEDVRSCRGVGLEASDLTIGDFMGSIFSRFANQKFDYPIIRVAYDSSDQGEVRHLEITLHYVGGEEEWRWGIRFNMDKNGEGMPESIACFVAG